MQITLGEDDGFLFGGVPHNVVVSIVLDDGRKLKFPYSAEKSMSALYEDLKNISPLTPSNVVFKEPESSFPIREETKFIPTADASLLKEIENGDFVVLVKLEDRGQGATVDLRVGGEYRVVKVHSKNLTIAEGVQKHIVDGYDVVDDSAPSPMRTYVFAHEVQLSRKKGFVSKKGPMLMEEIVDCPYCGDKVASVVKENSYEGKCDKCGEFKKPREVKVVTPNPTA